MSNTKIIYTLFFLLSLLHSCKKDDSIQEKEVQNEYIYFNIAINRSNSADAYGIETKLALSAPISRTDFSTQFTVGDSIGVFAVPTGQPLANSSNLIHNIKVTYNGTDWQSNIKWPLGNPNLDFYAYYPYDPQMTNPNDYKFVIKSDQSKSNNYAASDLMSAKSVNKNIGSTVSLNFTHLLTLMQVELPETSSTGAIPDPRLEIILNKLQNTTTFNLSSNHLTMNPTVFTSIRPHRVEQTGSASFNDTYTYRALVPAQTLPANQDFIIMNQGFTSKVSKQKNTLQMTAGKSYRISVDDFPSDNISTVFIKAGTFLMGNPDPNALGFQGGPAHWVKLTKDFCMTKYEITISQYAEFLNAIGVTAPQDGLVMLQGEVLYNNVNNESTLPIYDMVANKYTTTPGFENYPMNLLYYTSAKAYATWAGGKLPTEAQWEYAARAGSTTPFYFGTQQDLLTDYAWISENSNYKAQAVGQKIPNAWGLYDMYGNVAEITDDKNTDSNTIDPYPTISTKDNPLIDPINRSGSSFIIRGGSFISTKSTSNSYLRSAVVSGSANYNVGFRVVFEK
ncbi:SUMF1/EgtB/PvdO family nonheme iron enzyme [Sphingobacterium bovistauri]|uniref:SUMF1/EgtB/PvdO family nonheme iron enzyme n=1 Tax=Sphingobacterium bovistauri TaxID=2781959 RepID=A0ABS7Z733_9SPHI|nr:SUMF1/EgtB/PvdO family nonheme iron enzyme [Sphingobacterium bovistauri]MCA5004764.1 SUMF1/EgtB/PvdO family nonheme iron enzyme [Sphingobacterium bovistauri]